MHLAMDVDYREDGGALAAGALFPDWGAAQAERFVIRRLERVAPYRPGRFFERELPCLLAVLEASPCLPETILIDGYVTLGAEKRDGLGAHLFAALNGEIPVIGIAKTRFHEAPADTEVLRGTSLKPLYVTSLGLAPEAARATVRAMHGAHRIPTILAAVDRACREG